jgi:hypothetical protein
MMITPAKLVLVSDQEAGIYWCGRWLSSEFCSPRIPCGTNIFSSYKQELLKPVVGLLPDPSEVATSVLLYSILLAIRFSYIVDILVSSA